MNRIRSIRVLFCCAIGEDVLRLGIGVGSLLDLRQEDVAAHQRNLQLLGSYCPNVPLRPSGEDDAKVGGENFKK